VTRSKFPDISVREDSHQSQGLTVRVGKQAKPVAAVVRLSLAKTDGVLSDWVNRVTVAVTRHKYDATLGVAHSLSSLIAGAIIVGIVPA
jgi:predicted alpha/beta hydrolase family esterase